MTRGPPVQRQRVASTNLASVGYDGATQTLEVRFLSGRIYRYHGVPENLHEQLMQATSKGQFFNAHIRDHHAFSRVD